MTLIEQLGLISVAFVLWFTIHAARHKSSVGGQTMQGAIVEAWVNIFVGFTINWILNMTIMPLADLPVTANSAFWLGCVYTAASIVRQFFLRRLFNWMHEKGLFA